MCHPITLFQLIKPSRPITLSHHQAVPILSRYSIPPSCPNHITPSFAHPITLCHLIKLSQSHHPILLSCPYPILSHHPISSSSPHPITSSNIIKLSPSYHIIPSCPYPIKLSHTIKLSTCYHHFISSSCPDAITSSHIIKISSSYHIIRSNQAVTSSHLINLSQYLIFSNCHSYITIPYHQAVNILSHHLISLSCPHAIKSSHNGTFIMAYSPHFRTMSNSPLKFYLYFIMACRPFNTINKCSQLPLIMDI